MSLIMRTVGALWLCLVPGMVTAGLIQFRSQVQASLGTGTSTDIQSEIGGLNETSVSLLLESPFNDSLAVASSSLSPSGFVPTLKAKAVAASTRAQAVAWGVQGYTNTGATPLETALQLNLTAEITGDNDISASVYLFQVEGFQFAMDPGTILYESTSQLWPGFSPFANNLGSDGFDIQIKDFTGSVNETRSFAFTVNPNESFYVWAWLVTTADQPGVVDAFSTLTAELTKTEGLVPAATADGGLAAVPEPSSLLLALSGAMGVGLFVRRCRRRVER